MTAWVGCAAPSPPLPPSLNLPKPVSDVRAVRKGNKVYLAWTIPTHNTDETIARRLGVTRICRSLDEIHDCSTAVGEVAPPPVAPKLKKNAAAPTAPAPPSPAIFVDDLPYELLAKNPTRQIFYAVSVSNSAQRAAALSNAVPVPAALTPPAPRDLKAEAQADGVLVTWDASSTLPTGPGLRSIYRVFRRGSNATQSSAIGDVEGSVTSAQFLDRNFEWEKPYSYTVSSVTIISQPGKADRQVEGEDAAWLPVVPHDIFPPAVPSGLEAVQSGSGQKPFVDLIWAPVGDADLAGYEVYRSDDGDQPHRINDAMIKTPAYRDQTAQPGKIYSYSVSAVDLRGNESARSAEATESLP